MECLSVNYNCVQRGRLFSTLTSLDVSVLNYVCMPSQVTVNQVIFEMGFSVHQETGVLQSGCLTKTS
jgi:hypothetical protein